MKSIIIAIALAAAATAAAASPEKFYLSTPDGDLTLDQTPCPSGGKEAMLIETRANGGGAYGCWALSGDKVNVVWTSLIGPTGSILKSNMKRTYQANQDMISSGKR